MKNWLSRFFNLIYFSLPFCCCLLGYLVANHWFCPKEVVTPNLIGRQLSDCTTELAEQKLSIRFLNQREDDVYPEGTILEQIPKPGNTIKLQQQILLVTTKKPEVPKTPSFVGLTQEEATNFAKTHGFALTYKKLPTSYFNNRSFAQSPLIGEPNDTKKITVLLGESKPLFVIVPSLIGKTTREFLQLTSQIQIKTECFCRGDKINPYDSPHILITNQNPMPGSIIDLKKQQLFQIEVE